jgi:hypothetical protein
MQTVTKFGEKCDKGLDDTRSQEVYFWASIFISKSFYLFSAFPGWGANQGPYSQHCIFFVTYESAQLARAFHNTRLERLANDKLSPEVMSYLAHNVCMHCAFAAWVL